LPNKNKKNNKKNLTGLYQEYLTWYAFSGKSKNLGGRDDKARID
jgi:hypothetical protein